MRVVSAAAVMLVGINPPSGIDRYTAQIHCSNTLRKYTAQIYCSDTLLKYTAQIHCSVACVMGVHGDRLSCCLNASGNLGSINTRRESHER